MVDKHKSTEYLTQIFVAPLLLVVAVVWLVLLVVFYPFRFAYEQWLTFRFWQRHGKYGRFVLFIYSDSPNWKDYIEANILPRLEPHVVTLNWSERQKWKRSNPFEARLFSHWAGESEFNPLALIFAPTGKVQGVRFWQAFKDLKHGKDRLLKQAESLLFTELERIAANGA
jgi:hypothetical protein